jgi:hypothetical protein
MDIVDSGGKTNNQPIVDGNGDMVPRVFKKFPGQFGVDGVVEYPGRDVHECAFIATLQHFDFDGHSIKSPDRVTKKDSRVSEQGLLLFLHRWRGCVMFQKLGLAFDTATVTNQRTIGSDHAMTSHDDSNRIRIID